MNKTFLSGRLTENPELKTTPSGISICTFGIAVGRNNKDEQADFFTIVAWKEKAEFVSKYLSKGRKVLIEGELRTNTYTDKNGNKRKKYEIIAHNIEFADAKPDSNTYADDLSDEPTIDVGCDDDLPF